MGGKALRPWTEERNLRYDSKAWLQQNDQTSSNFKTCSVKDTVKRLQETDWGKHLQIS